jgi:hypothetical protein
MPSCQRHPGLPVCTCSTHAPHEYRTHPRALVEAGQHEEKKLQCTDGHPNLQAPESIGTAGQKPRIVECCMATQADICSDGTVSLNGLRLAAGQRLHHPACLPDDPRNRTQRRAEAEVTDGSCSLHRIGECTALLSSQAGDDTGLPLPCPAPGITALGLPPPPVPAPGVHQKVNNRPHTQLFTWE